mgnify:CR=1 FL=1|tara:strand:- start:15750 stop:16877 length:1128 start_codon:yes stop_codon:yes gene_type:complete
MKVGFFIDKSQTVQSVLALIRECQSRGYDCDIFSTCKWQSLVSIPKIGIELESVNWMTFKDRHQIKSEIIKNHSKYRFLIGINMFNNIWREIYEKSEYSNIYAVEYCWNEIYNGRTDYAGSATLFSNSDWSKDTIKNLTGYSKVQSLGSPWFEIISDFKKLNIKEDNEIITFMAPHNSFVSNYEGFLDDVKIFLSELREFCNRNGYSLILKSRAKYLSYHDYHNFVDFDGYLYDNNIISHLSLYKTSKCVFNFCSSAVNELSILQTPYVCLFSDMHANLHKSRENLFKAMDPINKKYYSGAIFDGVHCKSINRGDTSDKSEFRLRMRAELDKTLDLINREDRDWDKFQERYFSKDSTGASSRIIDFIEKECPEIK